MNNAFKWLAFSLLTLMASAAGAAEFCDDSYYIDQTLANGARWDMCWEHRAREGAVYHHIHYTPANGERRKVLHQASVAQIHVPYDDNGSRFHDVSDYGIGNYYMLNLTAADCPGGTLLTHETRPLLCKQILDESFGYTFGGESVQSQMLSLYSVSTVGAYNYIPAWHFYDNGTIEPGMGATGALQRFGGVELEDHGWALNATTYGLSHLHNYFWKLDFDLGDNGNDDFVEELNFIASGGKRLRATTRYTQEVARTVDPDKMRSWRIVDGQTNGNGHANSYEILLRDSGHKDLGPSVEPFTFNDIFFTRQKNCEIYASHNPTVDGCTDNLASFVNSESLNGQDLVVWASLTFYHVPRAEDTPYMDAHWNFFQITPRDWHNANPYSVSSTNNPPGITSPGSQSTAQNSSANLAISASDIDGDGLSFSAAGLPPGLSINASTGLISGIATATGSYTVTVTVSDGQASQSTLFNWTITAATGSWTSLGSYLTSLQATPPAGWSFLWNANGSIGNGAAYTALKWTGSSWDGDGIDGQDSSDLSYGQLNASGGHAGRGISQGASASRYVISRYTTTVAAGYRIQGSSAAHSGCQWSDGLDLRVYVNDSLVSQRTLAAAASAINFDQDLGTLAAGVPIDVAVGPSGHDGCDAFSLNYTVQSTESAVITNQPPSVSSPGNQSGEVNTPVSLTISASDPDGDSLTYSASGLPGGLSINAGSGAISGTPTAAGTFNTIVSVSDGQASRAVSFSWTITGTTTQWTTVGTYANSVTQTPPAGWSFLWNAYSAIGSSFGYTPLNWFGYGYDSDGVSGAAPDELAYGYLNSSGGHTGKGIQQGAGQSRFVISRYTTPAAADYRITASSVNHSGCQWSDGVDARVYVNDVLKLQHVLPVGGVAQNLNQVFSALPAGSHIDVAVGPSGSDGCDTFSLGYTLQRSGGTSTPNHAPVITNPGNQTTSQGSSVSMIIQASDPDGDSLSFSASGLPAGLSINSATGQISGTAANAGNYNTLVVVTDGQINSVASFTWTVSTSSANWTNVGRYSSNVVASPGTGWSFLWNANGAIGQSTSYATMKWYGYGYDADGIAGVDANDLAYGYLDSVGGHTGKGTTQGATDSRYVISRYTVGTAGTYRITEGSAQHSGCQWTDGLDLRIYVNDSQRLQRLLSLGASASNLDLDLGALAAGSRIDVAVGPSGSDGCDAFNLDYLLQRQQ